MQRRVPRSIGAGGAPDGSDRSRVLPLLFGVLLFGSMVFGGAIWTAPPLIIDWQVKDLVRADDRASVSDVRCLSLAFLFHSCNVAIRLNFPSDAATRSINYVFAGPLDRHAAIRVLVDPNHRDIVTTDFGLQHLLNRTLTLGLGTLPFLLMFAVACYGFLLMATGQAPSKR